MIQLESENKSLKERCIQAEKMGSKLQTEVRLSCMYDVIPPPWCRRAFYMYISSDWIYILYVYSFISSIKGRTPLNKPKWPC